MNSKNQHGKEPGKDKLLTAVFIGVGLASFCYVAYNASNHKSSGTGNGEMVTPKPPEPPPGPMLTSSPPDIVRAYVDDLAIRRASSWTDKGVGNMQEIIGSDSSGRTIVDLAYSQPQGYLGHYVFEYYENQTEPGVTTVQIQKFEPMGPESPGIFHNRCVGSTTYKLDRGKLLSVELTGVGGSLEGIVYFEYDKWNGYLWCIRKVDSSGQQISSVYSVGQQELSEALSPYYLSAQFSQRVP